MPEDPDPRFWALQISTYALGQPDETNGRGVGGAHIGLSYGRGAERGLSWTGYDERKLAAGKDWVDARLDATLSRELAVADPEDEFRHYRYPWREGEGFRIAVAPTPGRNGWWRGTVTDLSSGEKTVVCDLNAGGDSLGRVMVWSEVFAPCDARSASVIWSDLRGARLDGSIYRPKIVRVNYQPYDAGGCGNTNVEVRPNGAFRQVTNAVRVISQDTELAL